MILQNLQSVCQGFYTKKMDSNISLIGLTKSYPAVFIDFMFDEYRMIPMLCSVGLNIQLWMFLYSNPGGNVLSDCSIGLPGMAGSSVKLESTEGFECVTMLLPTG
jgi:hypothetical protein